jgi:hypothetical protein
MIIETPYKAGDTISFKTVAGEEVIARLKEETADILKVDKPMALTASQQGLGMVPFTFTISPSTSVNVQKSALVFIAKTDEEMAKQYIESTTSIKMV